MKKFISLCAFVAALSFVSCGGNTASNAGADSTKVDCCKGEEAPADSTHAHCGTETPADSTHAHCSTEEAAQ